MQYRPRERSPRYRCAQKGLVDTPFPILPSHASPLPYKRDTMPAKRTAALLSLLVALLLTGPGCISESVVRQPVSPHAADAPHQSPARFTQARAGVKEPAVQVSSVLETLGHEGKSFHAHVTTLGNPFFEGRAPGTHGIEMAADYIQHYFEFFGLEPAFPHQPAAVGANLDSEGFVSDTTDPGAYRQPFDVPGETSLDHAGLSYTAHTEGRTQGATLALGEDFNPLAFGSTGHTSGELAFVGYAIEDGENDYSSFGPHDDLTGDIVMLLRFEPMNEKGESLWADGPRWSPLAALLPKVQAVLDRGAAGVILVNAPGADDPRADKLMTLKTSRFGGPLPIPAVMMTEDAANALLAVVDLERRSLLDLRKLADAGERKTLRFPDVVVEVDVEINREDIQTANIGGVLRGKGNLAGEWIVIGAHYDHIGYGKFGSLSPGSAGEVHPGADDNASGTAGLLTLIDMLSSAYDDMPEDADARSILFLAFSAEEMGLLGSRHFVEYPSIPLDDVNVMINMDMIGRLKKTLQVSGAGTGNRLREVTKPIFEATDVSVRLLESGQMPSDQTSFLRQDVPVLGFFTGTHREYHTVNDVPSLINHNGAVKVIDLVADTALAFATDIYKNEFVTIESPSTVGAVRNSSVRLGIAPGNYGDVEPGVEVGDVYEGTTADKGGLQTDDRIITWNGEEMGGVPSLMERLSEHKPGDVVHITVLRDGKNVNLKLTMQARGTRQ